MSDEGAAEVAPPSSKSAEEISEEIEGWIDQGFDLGREALLNELDMVDPSDMADEVRRMHGQARATAELFDDAGLRPVQALASADGSKVWVQFHARDVQRETSRWNFALAAREAIEYRRRLHG